MNAYHLKFHLLLVAGCLAMGSTQSAAGQWVIHEEEQLTLAYREGSDEDGRDLLSIGCHAEQSNVWVTAVPGHKAPTDAVYLIYGDKKLELKPVVCSAEEPCEDGAAGDVDGYTGEARGRETAIAIANARSVSLKAPGADLNLTIDGKVAKSYLKRCPTYEAR